MLRRQADEVLAACTNSKLQRALFSATVQAAMGAVGHCTPGTTGAVGHCTPGTVQAATGAGTVLRARSLASGPRPWHRPCLRATIRQAQLLRSSIGLCGLEQASVETLALTVLSDPVHIQIGTANATTDTIKQKLVYAGNEEGKLLALRQIFGESLQPPTLIFVQASASLRLFLGVGLKNKTAVRGLALVRALWAGLSLGLVGWALVQASWAGL